MAQHYHLAGGIAIHNSTLLMVASQYPNHAEPLWNLPGGRQQPGELLAETVAREFFEETGLRVEAREVAYVSESYDGDAHFLSVVFVVQIITASFETRPFDSLRSRGSAPQDDNGDHVVAVEWVPLDRIAERIVVDVVREPLLAYLRGELPQRYAGFHDAGITIEWPPDSR